MIQGVEVVQLVIWSTDQGVEFDPLVIGQHADQGVEVDSRIVQLVIWSTDQGVEVDPLVIGQHVWSTRSRS